MWDTFGLFELLLKDVDKLSRSSQTQDLGVLNETFPLRMAKVGFTLCRPEFEWSLEHSNFILERLERDLSLESLEWYEECAEATRAFACLALGTMLGKFSNGEIDEADFTLGDAHLFGFIAEKNEDICSRIHFG